MKNYFLFLRTTTAAFAVTLSESGSALVIGAAAASTAAVIMTADIFLIFIFFLHIRLKFDALPTSIPYCNTIDMVRQYLLMIFYFF